MGLKDEEKKVIADGVEKRLRERAEAAARYEQQRLARREQACCTELADAVEGSLVFDGEIGGAIKIVEDDFEPEVVHDVRFCPFCGTKLSA